MLAMTMRSLLYRDGYELVPHVLSADACDAFIAQLGRLELPGAGSRNFLAQSWCCDLALALKTNCRLRWLLPDDAVAFQRTLFEKSSGKNWGVGLHQDLSMPVREQIDAPGYDGWSRKEGVLYVQPPSDLLETLVAVRLHLDPCWSQAGPLRVVPGSHRFGRLSDAKAGRLRTQQGEVECVADRGAALVMRPLLLHASSRTGANTVRRILHFLFGPRQLPYGLCWHQAV